MVGQHTGGAVNTDAVPRRTRAETTAGRIPDGLLLRSGGFETPVLRILFALLKPPAQ